MLISRSITNCTILTALLCAILAVNVAAATKYKVTVSSGVYNELAGATDLAFSISDSGYYYQSNFVFPVFDRLADMKQNVAMQSNGAFLSSEGYIAIYEAPGYKNTIVLQCLYNSNDFAAWPGTTKVSAKMEGTIPGSRILKFQWKDIISNNDINQRVNLQVWLNEADSSISYHYGPNSLASQAGQAYTGIIVLAQNFYDVLDECNLEGSPAKPAVYDTFKTVLLPTLDSIPRNGTIYYFTRVHTSSVSETGKASGNLLVYPNPANTSLTVQAGSSAAMVTLYDIAGRTMATTLSDKGMATLQTHNIPAGMYWIRVDIDGLSQYKKVCISH